MATTFDADGNLWVSTNGGINRFNLDEYNRTGQKEIHSVRTKYDLIEICIFVE